MEIRRIHQGEGDVVGELWDRMCREDEDGGPLTERGRRDLSRMLAMSAWHRDAFCLVAVDGVQVIGFVNGRTGIGDGLLPGVLGEIDSLYVVPEERDKGISRALAGGRWPLQRRPPRSWQAGPAQRTPERGTGIKHSPGAIRPASSHRTSFRKLTQSVRPRVAQPAWT